MSQATTSLSIVSGETLKDFKLENKTHAKTKLKTK